MLRNYRQLSRRRPRVLQVTAYYPPHLGGQETVVEELARGLSGAGADVEVVTSRLPRRPAEAGSFQIKRLWAREVAHTPVIPALPLALGARLRGGVVYLLTGQAFVPEVVGLVCRALRPPYIARLHLLVRPSGPRGRLLPAYQRAVLGPVLRHAGAVVCLSEDMRGHIIEDHGVVAERAVVIPNGVTEGSFMAPERARQPGHVLFVARLAVQKNLAVAIRAMAHVPGGQLSVIGDGEERPALGALVAALQLTNVAFLGVAPAARSKKP